MELEEYLYQRAVRAAKRMTPVAQRPKRIPAAVTVVPDDGERPGRVLTDLAWDRHPWHRLPRVAPTVASNRGSGLGIPRYTRGVLLA